MTKIAQLTLNKLNIKQLDTKYFDSLSKLFYELGIDGQEYVEKFIQSYVIYAYKKSKTKSDTLLATGFGRRYIEKYIDKNISPVSVKKRNQRHEFIESLKTLSEKNPNNLIKIQGKKHSFNSVYQNIYGISGDVTCASMLKTFIRISILEKHSKEYVKFKSGVQSVGDASKDDVIRVVGETLNRLFNIYIHNMQIKKSDKPYFERSIRSTNILKENHRKCLDELTKAHQSYLAQSIKILEKYEEKDLFSKNKAKKQEIEIGCAQYIFINKI